ncbi:ADP-ribosylation factor-like protein 13b [Plakobranchus ocellatus]|uniref:ADP-ribosylation factor-like protein 13b n=1 Tax=Plakobranchus ocellatus TaxID=259542 RepID=A0AAV3YEK1_9GAST|nr:ADP-ribosylation factor-like protein 13b [Plakobranchus ocellatus]
MGNCVSIIKRKREPNKSITLAIIGLDDAGKTTVCSVLSGEQPDPDIAPTVGFRNIKFSQCNFDVTVFDVGGGKNIRPIWKNYYGEVYAIIYVIDSSSPSRLSEARDVFRESLEHPQLSGKPVLVLANKVDKESHMTESDITHGLRLEETVNASNCPSKLVLVSAIQGSGSKMDKGIAEGIDWLLQRVRTLLPSLEPRVEEDMKREQEARDKEREERRARVKKQREEREKAEELERTRLGLEKKPDSDDDDIVDGNPFKALDINELKKKEQRLKAEKKEKQKRLKELGNGDRIRMRTDSGSEQFLGRRGYKNHLSDDDGPAGLKMDDIETNGSALAMFGRSNRASMLPPLEPLGSVTVEGAEKKRQKKKKRLTDYHLQENSDHAEGLRTVDRLGLTIPGHLGRDSDVHDLTPRNAKPKASRGLIQAGRISREEEEGESGLFQQGSAASRRIHLVGGIDDDSDDGIRKSVRSSQEKVKSKSSLGELDSYMYGSKKVSGMEKYPREIRADSLLYRNSLTKISPPNLRPFEEEDEGIEQDDSDNNNNKNVDDNSDDDDAAELERFRASRRAHKLGSARIRREAIDADRDRHMNNEHIDKKYHNASREVKGKSKSFSGRKNRRDSDDDDDDDDAEDEYGTYNPLKDTLRFSYDDTRDLTKEMENLRRRQETSGHGNMNGYRGQENRGYDASPTKPRTRLRGNSEDYDDESYTHSKGSRGLNSRNLQSPDEYEDYKDQLTDQRKKKKRNLLRSNKLAPSDNEDAHRFGSPRMVQEHGSRNASDAETPTKNRNSRITQFHRNDSDFNTKWGLAEDLPAIDGSLRRRVPNFDDSDEGDVVF